MKDTRIRIVTIVDINTKYYMKEIAKKNHRRLQGEVSALFEAHILKNADYLSTIKIPKKEIKEEEPTNRYGFKDLNNPTQEEKNAYNEKVRIKELRAKEEDI